jgi:predicted metalloendopeptidase
MDTDGLDATGVDSLAQYLDLIKEVNDTKSLMSVVGKLHAIGVPALFKPPRPADDLSNGTTNLLQLVEGGLALPSPSYYGGGMVKDYSSHVAKMLQLLRGTTDERADADAIVAFETKLAGISVSQTGDYMKANASYHPLSVTALEIRAPGGEWSTYFGAIGFDFGAHEVNPVNQAFFDQLPTTVNGVNTSTLQSYLQWQLVHAMASALPSHFASETWQFFQGVLEGAKSPPARESVCLGLVNNGNLGWLLAKEWIDRRFAGGSILSPNTTSILTPPTRPRYSLLPHNLDTAGDSKDIATAMFIRIRDQFSVNAQGLDWLDVTTRAYAVAKSKALVHQVTLRCCRRW